VKLSYCIVNTNGADYLPDCLEAVGQGPEGELLVLDNASDDGSAELANIRLEQREGKAANDSRLLREARGEYALLLNEDAELHPGAAEALVRALDDDPGAAAVGAQLVDTDGRAVPCAWRLPGVGPALAVATGTQRLLVTQSGGTERREVGWCQSSALLVRRSAAEQVGYLDPDFFVYSDETDFCKRLRDAGWRILFEPAAVATHHNQLGTDREAEARRLAEFHRNRDLYLRKHHSTPARLVTRALWVIAYLERALLGRSSRMLRHARHELVGGAGEGIREAAAARNERVTGAG
jgi:GT2 family glycosyltransferase